MGTIDEVGERCNCVDIEGIKKKYPPRPICFVGRGGRSGGPRWLHLCTCTRAAALLLGSAAKGRLLLALGPQMHLETGYFCELFEGHERHARSPCLGELAYGSAAERAGLSDIGTSVSENIPRPKQTPLVLFDTRVHHCVVDFRRFAGEPPLLGICHDQILSFENGVGTIACR